MKLFRGRVFTPVADPFAGPPERSYVSHDDGFVAVERDRIVGVGAWDQHPHCDDVVDFGRDALITPGFVDTHLHAPQIEMMISSSWSHASCAFEIRSSGAFSSSFCSQSARRGSRSGLTESGDGIGSLTCRSRIAIGVSVSWKGTTPAKSS